MRRGLLGLIAAGLAAALAGGGGMAAAQQAPIKIGLIVSLTGRVAQNGRDMVNGLTLGLDRIRHRAAGREIQVVVENDGGTPAGALTKARKRVELDRVDLLMTNGRHSSYPEGTSLSHSEHSWVTFQAPLATSVLVLGLFLRRCSVDDRETFEVNGWKNQSDRARLRSET